MKNKTPLFVAVLSIWAVALFAQSRNIGNEWPTAQGDAQRTNWLRSDPNISVDTLSKPGFELQWKAELEGQRGMKPAVQGVSVNGVTLFTPLSIVTGDNDVVAIDNDTGATFWYRSFGAAPSTSACAAPVAATRVALLESPAPTAARGGGAGGGRGGYSSSVGSPGEGAPVPARGGGAGRGVVAPGPPAPAGAPGAAPAPPPAGAPATAPAGQAGRAGAAPGAPPGAPGAAPGRGGGGGFGRPSGVVYVIARDGMLHVVGLPSSKDIQKPAQLVPAGARVTDPIAVNDILYTSTTGKCGGTVDAVYAMDLAGDAKTVVSYKTTGSPVGTLALATDGTVVVAVTNGVVTLDPKTLAVRHSYSDPAKTMVTGPLVFRQNDKDMVAVGTKDGQILLLDANTMAVSSATPAFTTAGATFAGEALSFWQEYSPGPVDPAAAAAPPAPAFGRGGGGAPAVPMIPGRAWLLAATNNSVVAWKIADDGGKLTLQPGWTSPTLSSPVPPVIVNNVVFAVSSGKPAAAAGSGTPAVLYALDGMTGKALWNSGTAIKSYMPGRALWTANSQVYVGGNDGAVYAFGFPLDRR